MKRERHLFDDKIFYKNLYHIVLPIVIQNFIGSFLNMIDTMMIGKIGETEIAAVGIANQYFFLFFMLTMSVYSGCGVFIAQFWGKKDEKNIKKVMGVGLISGIIFTLIFTIVALLIPEKIIALFNKDAKVIELGAIYLRSVILSYIFTTVTLSYSFALRNIGKTIPPMLTGIVAILVNTFFNYILIFGKFGAPAMGVKGAAIATLIARVVEAILIVFYVYKTKSVFAASIKEMTDVTFEFVVTVYKTMIPVMLNEVCWALGAIVYSMVYGRIGTQAVASIQICNTVLNLFLVAIFGLANSASVMIGTKVGAGEEDTSRDYAWKFSILGVIAGVLLGAILAVTAPYILKLFNVSQKVLNDSLLILYIDSVALIIKAFNIILMVGILRGAGDAKNAFIIESCTMWLIGVPIALIGALYFKLPVYVLVALLTIEEITKCIFGLIRFKSGKWINNVVQDIV